MFNEIPIAEYVVPQMCVGGTFDIPTGKYFEGEHGEMILNAGLGGVNSVTGPENSFKTGLSLGMLFTAQSRHTGLDPNDIDPSQYPGIRSLIYDSENSCTYGRIEDIVSEYDYLSELDFSDDESRRLITLTPGSKIWIDHYFDALKKFAKQRAEEYTKKSGLLTTPFLDQDKLIQAASPMIVLIDTLTEAKASSISEKITENSLVGATETNMLYMRDAAAKTQMISQMPYVSSQGGVLNNIMFMMTAHTAPKPELDPYAPKEQRLSFSRKGATTKGTSKKFSFININLLEIFQATPLFNSSSDRTAKYPLNEADKTDGTTDLMLITAVNTRNKNGPSGTVFNFVFSQSRGWQPTLTEFFLCKETYKSKDSPVGFGFSGNNTWYTLDLYPDQKVSRSTVRGIIDENPRWCRAMEITSEIGQLKRHNKIPEKYTNIEPSDLYTKLKDDGYDWDVLLDTRGWWTYREFEKFNKPYLSTYDLLRMYAGEYHPYWMEKK